MGKGMAEKRRPRALLQLPEGLKAKACELSRGLEAKGFEVLLSASPCFGACDLALNEASAVGAKKIFHYGHAEFPLAPRKTGGIEVEFVEWPSGADVAPVLGKALADPDFGRCAFVALVTTVQHVPKLGEMRRILEAGGKKVLVGKPGPRAKYAGQVLGCDQGAALSVAPRADCVLYVGGGLFHPAGVAGATGKRVLAADPFSGKVAWMDAAQEKLASRRKALMMAAALARRFGIIVSVKPGQENLRGALALKKSFECAGRKAGILVTDFVSAEALQNFGCFDAFVITACPRLAIDDWERFGRPALTLEEGIELARQMKGRAPRRASADGGARRGRKKRA
jgi:2-(3-amino-3-carboxypropyl)histidine synthase